MIDELPVVTDTLQKVMWPGVAAFESFRYECNHGVSPNCAVLTTYPQPSGVIPKEFGDLVFTDGSGRPLTIKGCRAKFMTGTYSSQGGQTWVLHILDPRWQWGNNFGGLGGITGWYNRKDNRGELIPWTIRSAEELITLCLRQMNVRRYRIRAPKGYTKKDGEALTRRLFLGERFKPSGTNLEFCWDHTPPAEALNQVCTQHGLRIVYRPFTGDVIITPPGVGRPLPEGAMEMEAPNIQLPELPVAVGAYGDPVRIQMRFDLEPIGKEWHGWPVEALNLSYAPPATTGDRQSSQVAYDGSIPPFPISIQIQWTDVNGAVQTITATTSATDITTQWQEISQQLNGNPTFSGGFSAGFSGSNLNLHSNTPGLSFDVSVTALDGSGQATYLHTVTDEAGGKGSDWSYSAPPLFPYVRATPELPYITARNHAQESVFRWYRIKMATVGWDRRPASQSSTSQNPMPGAQDSPTQKSTTGRVAKDLSVSTSWPLGADTEERADVKKNQNGRDGLWIPWYSELYGVLKRREQLVILNTMVDQVIPSPRIQGGQNQGNPVPPNIAAGILPESYTGVSRDQEAVVRGSIYTGIGTVNWARVENSDTNKNPAGNATPLRPMNTARTDRVYVPFQVMTLANGEQIVSFNEPVFYWNQQDANISKYDFPRLVLETSVYVRHPVSDMPLRWEECIPIKGGKAPIEWHPNPELKVGVVASYDDNDQLKGWRYAPGDIGYTKAAARFFLQGKAARYYVRGGNIRQYPMILNIEPDGLIQQVSWSLGAGGPTTIASANSEHSPFWPDYPQRVRPELLPPNKLAAQANRVEREWVERFTPNAGKKIN